jgi:hypothetical protein
MKVVLPAVTLARFNSSGVAGLYREDEALRLFAGWDWVELSRGGWHVDDGRVQAKDTTYVTDSVTNFGT